MRTFSIITAFVYCALLAHAHYNFDAAIKSTNEYWVREATTASGLRAALGPYNFMPTANPLLNDMSTYIVSPVPGFLSSVNTGRYNILVTYSCFGTPLCGYGILNVTVQSIVAGVSNGFTHTYSQVTKTLQVITASSNGTVILGNCLQLTFTSDTTWNDDGSILLFVERIDDLATVCLFGATATITFPVLGTINLCSYYNIKPASQCFAL